MKICVIAPVVLPILGPKQQYGGIELVIFLAVEELVRRGHDVTLFASGDSVTSAKHVVTVPKAIGQMSSATKERAINRRAYELAIAAKPDVIWDHTMASHAHIGNLRPKADALNFVPNVRLDQNKLAKTGGLAVVHTLHGPAKGYIPGVVKSLVRAGHFFVSISHDQAKRFAPYLPKSQYLGNVYNAVDSSWYTINEQKNDDYLVWLGRYGMEKGAHIALSVAHLLRLPIVLVGKQTEPHEKKFYKEFIVPKLEASDSLLSQIPLSAKAEILANARATLMTNLWPEPFGLVAVESMAAGTPVLGPALGALPEVVDGAGVLVAVDDLGISENHTSFTSSQQKYVERLVENFPKLKSIPSSRIRSRAIKLFSVKSNVDGYESAFKKAIIAKLRLNRI